MPVVHPSKDKRDLFQIVLPQHPTAEQTALKEKIDAFIEKIKRNESSPNYAAWVKKLQTIAENGFDAPQANPVVAIKEVDAFADEVRRTSSLVVQPSKDKRDLFQIVLPQHSTAEQTALKQKIDALIEKIKRNESSRDYLDWKEKLRAIAENGFDAPQANPAAAIKEVDALADKVTEPSPEDRAHPGAYEVKLPDPERTAEDKGISWREIIYNNLGVLFPVPPEQLKFKAEAEATLTTLQAIFRDEDGEQKPKNPTEAQRRFSGYQTKLLGIAQIGLQTPADPESARLWLNALHDEVLTQEGPRIKNGYMKTLGTWALVLAVLAAAAYLVLNNNPRFSTLLYAYRNLFVFWTGTMVGTWLSFGIRRQTISFKDLRTPEDDMVEPGIRLIFTGLISVAIAFVFICGMVTVNIGSLRSGDLLVHGSSALLIGMLFGVSELALPVTLTRRASQFVGEVGGQP